VLLHPPDRLLFDTNTQLENAGAQYNLGNMYDFGKGVLKDAKQAASWYQKAAEQGYAKAQSNLGAMYDGCCRDKALTSADHRVVRFKNPMEGMVIFEDTVKGKNNC
jgi:hypothetical protein